MKTFKQYLENQFQFDGYMLKKLFPNLIEKYRNITFDYEEKDRTFSAMCALIETYFLKLDVVEELSHQVFGANVAIRGLYKANHLGKNGLGVNLKLPDDYPKNVEISDISTGYYECIAKFSDTEGESPQLLKLVDDFVKKAEKLADLCNKSVDWDKF